MILWQNGQALPALANALLNVLLCLMAVGSGLVIGATLHR
jgi:fluoride ion exporter CrcB/FEX